MFDARTEVKYRKATQTHNITTATAIDSKLMLLTADLLSFYVGFVVHSIGLYCSQLFARSTVVCVLNTDSGLQFAMDYCCGFWLDFIHAGQWQFTRWVLEAQKHAELNYTKHISMQTMLCVANQFLTANRITISNLVVTSCRSMVGGLHVYEPVVCIRLRYERVRLALCLRVLVTGECVYVCVWKCVPVCALTLTAAANCWLLEIISTWTLFGCSIRYTKCSLSMSNFIERLHWHFHSQNNLGLYILYQASQRVRYGRRGKWQNECEEKKKNWNIVCQQAERRRENIRIHLFFFFFVCNHFLIRGNNENTESRWWTNTFSRF